MIIDKHSKEESYLSIVLNNNTICQIIELAALGNTDYRKVIEDSIQFLYEDVIPDSKEEPEDTSSVRG